MTTRRYTWDTDTIDALEHDWATLTVYEIEQKWQRSRDTLYTILYRHRGQRGNGDACRRDNGRVWHEQLLTSMPSIPDPLSLMAVARGLNVGPHRVARWAGKGLLKVSRKDGVYIISERRLIDFIQRYGGLVDMEPQEWRDAYRAAHADLRSRYARVDQAMPFYDLSYAYKLLRRAGIAPYVDFGTSPNGGRWYERQAIERIMR